MIKIKTDKKIKTLLLIVFLLFLQSCCTDENDTVPITTSSCEAKENYLKGRELADNLQRQKALEYFEKAIELDSKFALAYLGAAITQPKEEDIFQYLNKAVALVDEVSEGEKLIILAMQARVNRNQIKQLEYYQALEKKYPKDEYVLYQVGNFYFLQHEYETAIDYFKKLIKLNKSFAPVYNQLGYAYRHLEKYDLAENAFKQYIKLIPDNPNPYDSYGELLLKMGEYEASLEQYRKAIKHDSNFVASYLGMASNLVYISDYYEARLLLERFYNTTKDISDKRRALIFTAFSYIDEGNNDKAIKILQNLAEESKKNNEIVGFAVSNRILSAIYFETGDYEKAISFFKKSIQVIKDSEIPDEIKDFVNYDVLFGEALVAAKKKDFETAHQRADEFMKKAEMSENPNQIRAAHEIYGRIALEQKDYKKSIEELKHADLQNPFNLYKIATAYEKLNDLDKAKLMYKKTAKFNSLLDLNYAFCRNKAKNKVIDLQ